VLDTHPFRAFAVTFGFYGSLEKGYRMVINGNIKGHGAIRAFFGINMSKNENPSKQNDILVVVKVTLIYFTL
jgi:hypothetical protein